MFDECYLRNCVFDSCDFTGCRFASTNLHGSTFQGCKFDYCTFERTTIENDILDSGCPGHENLKMRFARSLRMNYQQLGDAKSANKSIQVELQATEIYLHKAWRSNESYYRKKYAGLKRAKMFAEWLGFKTLDFVWGNGESTYKLLRSTLLLLAIIGFIDWIAFSHLSGLSGLARSAVLSPQIFFGLQSNQDYPGVYATAILLTRLTAIAFFLSIVIKRFNRR